jgi:hypothetical protein
MLSRRSGARFNRGRVAGGGAGNPVQAGVASVDDAAPQEGGQINFTDDLTGITDGFTTTDVVAVLGGIDQGSLTDNLDDTWSYQVDPVTLANANGNWTFRRETPEGNRNSNAVPVVVRRVHAVIFPLPFALGAS